MESISPPNTKMSSPSASNTNTQHDDILFRRREKRRHVTPHAIDVRDPYSVIALAIRYDESISALQDDDGALLQVKLETGSIYNQKAFAKALLNLHKHTTTTSRHQRPLIAVVPVDPLSTPEAITPVILSGLIATIQERCDDDIGPSAVELVAYCRSMRRAALTRIRLLQRRRRIQRHVTPVVLVALVVGLLVRGVFNVKTALEECGFVGGEEEISCQSNKSCRLAATQVWKYCDPNHRLVIPGCTLDHCPVGENQLDSPFYAMHLVLRNLYMPLSEINNPRKSSSKTVWPHRRQSLTTRQQSEVRWLGETIVNRLIRETILDSASSYPISMLDVGCGVGGTLYALLDTLNPPSKPFRYHGIAISAPEIHQAKHFLTWHGLDTPEAATKTNSEIVFEQRNFDQPLPSHSYSVISAVESLSYSPDVFHTLHILMNALQKNGLLLIVDDMLAPWLNEQRIEELRNTLGKPSLKTYDEWATMIQSTPSLVQKDLWDLTLQFDMSYMLREHSDETSLFGKLVDTRHHILQGLAEKLTKWFGEKLRMEKNSLFQMIQLVENLSENDKATRARKQAYLHSDLIYYFMIVVKT